MAGEAFLNISKVVYDGPKSRNPIAFKHYNAEEKIDGKTMRDHLRFAVCYWHTFRNQMSDPFGAGTAVRPWDDGSNSVENAQRRVRVAFEFIDKLGAPFYCFHDRDVAPEGCTLGETSHNLDAVVYVLKEEQKRTGIKLLWGTANLFLNVPRHDRAVTRAAERLAVRLVHEADVAIAARRGDGAARRSEGAARARAAAAVRLAAQLARDPGNEALEYDLAALETAGFEKDSPAWEDRNRVLEHFRQGEDDGELLKRVKEQLDREHTELTTIIATLPDYVDSYSAWTFDPYLDAVQRAAGALRFAMDRFYLPDWNPEGRPVETGHAAAHPHNHEPGAVLFRGRTNGAPKLLLVLIALESPTAGVHKGALLSAIKLARALERHDALGHNGEPPRDNGEPLLVLGPSFSGSAVSLQKAFQTALEEGLITPPRTGGAPAVEVVSGSATLGANQAQLETGYVCAGAGRDCARLVRARSMMASAGTALRELAGFLGEIDADWKSGHRMAWLMESNTTWGQGVAGGGTAKDGTCSDRPIFPCAKVLYFPLHVSRLRTAASAVEPRPARGGPAPATLTSLRREDAAPFRDQLPAMRPELTSAMTETSLATILATLEHLDVTAVGLFGTDDRDKLFLAEQIRRRAPNVLLFTVNGSLAYVHPDYRSYTRGTVIASSYPLFGLTQALLPRAGAAIPPLQQFSAVTAEGVYNGVLALLEKPEHMLDYGERCGAGGACRPSVWISVVGEDAIWPLQQRSLDGPALQGYSWSWTPRTPAASSSPERIEARERLRWPLSAIVLFVGVAIVFALHLAVAVAVAWEMVPHLDTRPRLVRVRALAEGLASFLHRRLPIFEPPDACAERWDKAPDAVRRVQLRQEYWLSLLACGGAVLAMVALSSHVAAIGLNTGTDGRPSLLRVAAGVGFRFVLGCVFAAGTAAALWPTAARRHAGWGPVTAVRVLAVSLGLMALACLEQGFWARQWAGPLAGINAHRYALLDNLVSPVWPVLLLSAIVYTWGLWNLWRLHQQASPFGDCAVTRLLEVDHPDESTGLSGALDSPTLDITLPAALLLLALAGLQALVGRRFGATPDGQAVGRLLILGTMLVTLLVGHTLAHSFHLARRVLTALRTLNSHPIGEAFARLGRAPFLWKVSDGAPRAPALLPLLRQAGAVAFAFQEESRLLTPVGAGTVTGTVTVIGAGHAACAGQLVTPEAAHELAPTERRDRTVSEDAVSIDAASQVLARALRIRATDVVGLRALPQPALAQGDPARADALVRPLHAAPAWRHLEGWTMSLRRALERGPWLCHPFTTPEMRKVPRLLEEAETLLALQVSCALRQLLVRLTKGLTFASAGLVLVLAAHLLYSFQGRTFWLGLDWILLGLATLVVLYLFVRLERDPILSRIWATRPGQLDWNGELVRRILVYGAVPVVMLFVTFFPEVGAALFGWLEPVQKSLP